MKGFILKHPRFFRGMTNVFAAFLVLVMGIYTICLTWRGNVDSFFGVTSGAVRLSTDKEDYTYQSRFDTASESIESEKNLGIRIQQEGSVLLKGTPEDLKVEGELGVTLFGMRSYMSQFGSTIGSTVSKKADERIKLEDALSDRGFSVNPQMTAFYKELVNEYVPLPADSGNNTKEEKGAVINEVPQSMYTSDKTGDFSGYKDAAVIVLGRDAGESSSFYPGENGLGNPDEFSQSPTGNILSLSDDERDLIHYVEQQGFDKVIVLLNSVCTMEIQELKEDSGVDSILWIGTPGCYGFYGVADLLKGTVSPSGHLSDTYAVDTSKSPAVQNYGVYNFTNGAEIDPTASGDAPTFALRSNWYVAETEGIYVGYKYYETRYYDSVMGQGNASFAAHNETADGGTVWNYDEEVSYPFGYGIEGSEFKEELISVEIDWSGENDSTVAIRVENTGNTAAKHVVQLYVQNPYTEYDRENGVEKSAIQLIGYGKTGDSENTLLEPGDSEEVVITFNARDFASYDDTFTHDGVTGAYRLEAGDYYFATGNGAHDALQSVIKAQDPSKLTQVQPTGITPLVESLEKDVDFTKGNGDSLVQNRFEDADINQLNCGTTVTYLSRSDWSGTFPTEVTELTATPEMIKYLRNKTLDLEAANAETGETDFIFGEHNGANSYDMKGITDFEDPVFEEIIQATALENVLSSIMGSVVTDENTFTPRPYPSDSPLGYIVPYGSYNSSGIYALNEGDEGYGYEPNVFCSATVTASTYSHRLAEEQGMQMADDGFWTGVNWWFGPGLNLHRTPYNGRNIEYYSEDSVLSGCMAADIITAYQDMGMIAGVKHLAFNDQEANRDGIAVFFDEQGGRENELRSFEYALVKAGTKSVMTGFNRIGCTFSSADEDLVTGLMREEWGYNGFILTDSTKSADYMIADECLMAGTNMMLGGFTHYGSGKEWENINPVTLEDNPALAEAIKDAYHYYLYTLADSAVLNGISEESAASGMVIWEKMLMGIIGTFGTLTIICLICTVYSGMKQNRRKEGML